MSVKNYRRLKNCTLCGRAYVAIQPNQKFCCAECRRTSRRASLKAAEEKRKAKLADEKKRKEEAKRDSVIRSASERGISYAEEQKRRTLEMLKEKYGTVLDQGGSERNV